MLLSSIGVRVDVDLDHILVRRGVKVENLLVQRLLAHRLTGPQRQHFQYRVLSRSQHELLALQAEHAADDFVLERTDLDERAAAPLRAADERLEPGFELGELERLEQVIVRPEVQAGDAIIELAPCRQDQHRNSGASLAHSPQYVQPIHVGQGEIENGVIVFLGEQDVIRRGAIVDAIHGIAAVLQGLGQPFGELQIVFDQQYPHGFRSPWEARQEEVRRLAILHMGMTKKRKS